MITNIKCISMFFVIRTVQILETINQAIVSFDQLILCISLIKFDDKLGIGRLLISRLCMFRQNITSHFTCFRYNYMERKILLYTNICIHKKMTANGKILDRHNAHKFISPPPPFIYNIHYKYIVI